METITRIRRQLTKWEKILTCYSTDKGFISRINKGLKKLNSKRTNNRMGKGIEQTVLRSTKG
jgi:hypothetical protein